VKAPEFDYVAPESVEAAVAALCEDEDAKVLAGGQSLIALLNLRMTYPTTLVDLRRVPGLDAITADGTSVRIGAMARQRAAERDPAIRERCPLLADALTRVAHPQIRSRGTIGGSVAHADPAAELPAVLLALDGSVEVAGPGGARRRIAAVDLFAGFLTTSLEPGEIVVEVTLPAAGPRTGAACVEIARRHGDYAMCGAVAQVVRGDDGQVAEARLAFLGVSDTPVRARAAEAALTGTDGSTAAATAAAEHALDGWEPLDDPQMSAEYRAHLARVVARRAFEQAMEKAA
jgi:carbon-monoxide dehydrogenase medium subunit